MNNITMKDDFPLPRIDDILDSVGGMMCFTTLDLRSGYWEVQLEAEDQEKTAFLTHDGLYQFRVVPFGLTNAPATFQRLMACVLEGLQ